MNKKAENESHLYVHLVTIMKKIWHICFKSESEVFFRSPADHEFFFNGTASALVKTDSLLLAEAQMSNHCHQIVMSEDIRRLVQLERLSYVKYFNSKYSRTGPLGEKSFFALEIHGVSHLIAATVYTIRNPMHHGVTKTPFMYPYSSANCYFRKELGKDFTPTRILTKEQMVGRLPRRAAYNDNWKMNENGILLKESVIESALVETNFVSPQAFLYLVSRKSGEEWEREQIERDANGRAPITLELIEGPVIGGSTEGLTRMKENEKAHFPPPRKTDLEICQIIDNYYVPKYKKASVYCLSSQEKSEIGNALYKLYHVSVGQIRRCLASSTR